LVELNLLELPQIRHIHMIGIDGISMSGLAEILLTLGYKVSGSDIKTSNRTKKLQELNVVTYLHHSEENVLGADLIVYSAAIKETNPEIKKARELNIPIIDRATLLGSIMKKYKNSVAIAGTHGKTTTTSMVTTIMIESRLDPTVHIGAELDSIGGTTKIGGDDYFVVEACEYYGSFLKFHPYLAIVLNIEFDHADYFKDIEHIKQFFSEFVSLIPKHGYLVVCVDDTNAALLLNGVECNKITFGIKNSDCMWSAENISFDEKGCPSFDLIYNAEKFADIELKVPGIHNVYNALAAVSACYILGCDISSIKRGLLNFTNAHQRFELKAVVDNIRVIDDYAHHPSEIKATLKAAKNLHHSKIWCVFQPHTYTRTKFLMDEFANSFSDADIVVVSDIYAAREINNGEVNSTMLVEKIKSKGKTAVYIPEFKSIVEYLKQNVTSGDIVITMGAGNISKVGEMFVSSKKVMAVGETFGLPHVGTLL
jgi:UDP-N-acetylmuramate--alanine ligase